MLGSTGSDIFNLFLDNISVYIQTDNLTVCAACPWSVGQVNSKVSAGNPRRLYGIGIHGYVCAHKSIYKVAGLSDYYR